MTRTALVTHPACLAHVTPDHVPEQVARLEYVLRALSDLPLTQIEAPLAEDAQITSLHAPSYVAHIRAHVPTDQAVCLDAGTDGETFLSAGSGEAVWRAVGGAIRAVDAVLEDEIQNAFVATRPPGHHAEQAIAMGFCVFGNVALAAKHALDTHGLERVAILDFDVHHGNGTQALLQEDDRVLFVSSHQHPLWPGSGMASEVGPHNSVINLPLAPRGVTADWQRAYAPVWGRLADHRPQMIFVSAGFDAHQDDPLADMKWTAQDYALITAEICRHARALCKGRVVSVLEGGYDLDALARCARVHVQELIKAAE